MGALDLEHVPPFCSLSVATEARTRQVRLPKKRTGPMRPLACAGGEPLSRLIARSGRIPELSGRQTATLPCWLQGHAPRKRFLITMAFATSNVPAGFL